MVKARRRNKGFLGILLATTMLVMVVAFSFASTAEDVTIMNRGSISLSEAVAASGSSQDIQSAVNVVEAKGGGTVRVPEGDFAFYIDPAKTAPNGGPAGVIITGGVAIIGAGKERTILRQVSRPPDTAFMFTVDGTNGKPVRISGISFVGYRFTEEGNPFTRAICLLGATDYRVDHCAFEDFSAKAINPTNLWRPWGKNRGLIDHCDFDNPYMDDPNVTGQGGGEKVWPYGVQIDGTQYNWEPIDSLLGKYEGVENIVYIEDCLFKRCRHAVVASPGGGGFYVLRYCNITMPRYQGMTDVHGSYYPDPAVGGRGIEAYNNNFIAFPGYHYGEGMAFLIRGGGGVIYNNMIKDVETGVALAKEGPNPTCYVHNMYVWGNTFINTPTQLHNMGDFVEGVDFFLYAKPGYAPYTYPHPSATE